MNEIKQMKARYAQQIEDGRKIQAFTQMPEWNWYVDHVIKPTVEEYTERIMSGAIVSNKEDWITRGMVMGMKLMIESPDNFLKNYEVAKKKLPEIEEYERGTE